MKTAKMKTKNKRLSSGVQKSAKRGIVVKGKWKAVELDPSVYSEEGMEGLVCFEELTNYRLIDSEKTAAKAAKEMKKEKKKTMKRKVSEGEEEDEKAAVEGKEGEKVNEPAKKKAKKKRKRQIVMESVQDISTQITQKNQAANEEGVETGKEEASKDSAICSNVKSNIAKNRNKKKKRKQQMALSSLGFASPTPIQALALPPAIRDRMDILGAAETGSGKTLAFGIPIIHTILEWKNHSEKHEYSESSVKVESLYLPPTKSAEATTEDQEDCVNVEEDQHEGMRVQDQCDSDESATEDEEHGFEEDEKLGCVQVIDDAEFDFDPAVEVEEKPAGGPSQPLLGLVLTPTRELAVQVKHHIDAVAKFTDIKTAILVGGMAQQKQRRMLKRRPEIIIATPGRLWDMIKERHPHLLNLRQLRCLVIDEADRMVERGHFAELENLLEMLNTTHFNPMRQTFVFSATLTMAHSLPNRLLQKKRKNLDQRKKLEILMEKVGIKSKPKVIDLTRKEATVETLTETQIHCQKEEKDFYLYYFLLQYPGRTMVFANSIDCIKRLNSLLVILDCTPLPLHANMHQKQRLKNLERFAERDNCVLLTTDVAARGLDIPNVQHVIHYQVPRTSETYVHRSGRTARATKEGLSLLLIGPDDMMNFRKIYKTLGKDEEVPMFPIETKCMEAIKERVNLARMIEKIEFHNSREKQHNSWFKQAADALGVDLDDDLLLGRLRDEEADREQEKMLKGTKKHLKHLISQPVFKNVIKTKYPTQMGKLSLPHMPLAGMESALTSVTTLKKKQKLKKGVPQQRKNVKQEKKAAAGTCK
ncbi:ATP-dependent RNA helicase DDX24 [Channa argus]|uniref:ATP-dependent RNA helicase n=1 Tax=Channa argus TaxID=215402 RepID=A0A6G1QGJ5_CHAAH|nr:ATP-dependent RNA helicase DDX24 [Channa argus]